MSIAPWKRQSGGNLTEEVRLEQIEAVIEKRLFLGRVPENTTEDELRDVFREFGEVMDIRKVPGRTVAFVNYPTWGATHRALVAVDERVGLSGHKPGQTVVASFAERTSSVGRGGGAEFAKGQSNSRIWVGNLPPDVTAEEVKRVFDAHGPIRGCDLLPPKGSRRCGFVQYELWGEALDAIEALNDQPFADGCDLMRVMLARPRDKEAGHSDGPGVTPPWSGNRRDRDADDRGGGDAKRRRMDTFDEAEWERLKIAYLVAMDGSAPIETCNELHRALLNIRGQRDNAQRGVPLRNPGVTKKEPPRWNRDESPDVPRVDSDRLFIRGLPMDITDHELEALIDQIEFESSDTEILECKVLIGKCCGYVKFASVETAEEALQALDNRKVHGWDQMLSCEWAKSKAAPGQMPPSRTPALHDGGHGEDEVDYHRLFVGQIDNGIEDKRDLVAVFEEFGEVEDFNWLRDKALLFVTYTREADAREAMKSLDGKHVHKISRADGLNVQFAKKRRRG